MWDTLAAVAAVGEEVGTGKYIQATTSISIHPLRLISLPLLLFPEHGNSGRNISKI
jgi:hypothetical protein